MEVKIFKTLAGLKWLALLILFNVLMTGVGQAKMPNVTLDHKKIKANELAVFQNGKYEFIKMKEYEGVRYSARCFQGGKVPKCEAFKSLSKPQAKLPLTFEGNPGAQQCTQIGGINLIGISREKKEYNLCYFADLSYAVSWSLFYKLNDKPVIK